MKKLARLIVQNVQRMINMGTLAKLQTGFFAILSAMTAPITILNLLGGIVSGIWLAFLGEWGAIGKGIMFMVVSGFAISIALMPGLLFAAPASIAIEKGKKVLVAFLGSLSVLYTVGLITVWCMYQLIRGSFAGVALGEGVGLWQGQLHHFLELPSPSSGGSCLAIASVIAPTAPVAHST